MGNRVNTEQWEFRFLVSAPDDGVLISEDTAAELMADFEEAIEAHGLQIDDGGYAPREVEHG